MAERDAWCSFCRKNYGEVGPLVEGPGEVFICGGCIELSRWIIEQEQRRRRPPSPFPALEVIQQNLEQLIGIQSAATRVLARAASRHSGRISSAEAGQTSTDTGQAPMLLLTGPSEASKFFLVRALGHVLELPVIGGRATDLFLGLHPSASGSPFVHQLLQKSDYDIPSATRGSIYVSGLDQTQGQQAFLHFQQACIPSAKWQQLEFRTDQLLIIGGGSFHSLEAFWTNPDQTPEPAALRQALIERGMAAELAERFGLAAWVDPLHEDILWRVVQYLDFQMLESQPGTPS